MKRFITVIFILASFRCLYSQIWISTNEEGESYQKAVLANAVLNAFGEDTVSVWLENRVSIVAALSTDTMGYLRRILRLRLTGISFSSDDMKRLEQSWKKIGLRIPQCYERDYWTKEEALHEIILRDIRQESRDSLFHCIGISPLITYPLCLSVDSLKAEIIRRLGKVY